MYELEKALKEQIRSCKILYNYRCGIFVKHSGKKAIIMEKLASILKDDPEVEKVIKAPYNSEVRFTSGSILRIINTDNNARGLKNNGAIIDADMPVKVFRCIVLPTLVPRWIDDSTMEPYEEVNRRIFYCEI